jgi:hypothetical protein
MITVPEEKIEPLSESIDSLAAIEIRAGSVRGVGCEDRNKNDTIGTILLPISNTTNTFILYQNNLKTLVLLTYGLAAMYLTNFTIASPNLERSMRH